MKRYALCAAVLAALFVDVRLVQAQAFDSVRLSGGKGSVQGKISEVTKDQVVVTQGALKKPTPVNEILTVVYAGEPTDLSRARANAMNGAFDNARKELAKVKLDEVTRPEVIQDIEYFKAYCDARLALAGAGSLEKARDAMTAFGKAHPNSFHFYEACQLLGDLSIALKQYDKATPFYNVLGNSKFPDFKMRANVLLGRAAQAQDKHDQALAKFDEVLSATSDTAEGQRQSLSATLGKAVSLAATDKVDDAVKLVGTVIEKAEPEEVDLNARANNALGSCFLKAGKTKEALRSFLKTHLLYNGSPEAHAEALANLAQLWPKLGKDDRAQEALQMLKERYPGSVWAGKVGG